MDTNQQQTVPQQDWRRVLDRSAVIATLIGIPFILLLMYCAWLPLLMGMYFFILGGMLIGAIWFRLAARARPVPAAAVQLRLFTMLVLLSGLYLVSEYYVKIGHLSRDMANLTVLRSPVSTLEQRRARNQEAAAHVRQSLRQHGPGPLGYWAWAITSGNLPPMTQYTGTKSIPPLPQRQAFYVLRVVVSIVLLWYGLRLMAKDLAKPDEPVEIVENGAPAP